MTSSRQRDLGNRSFRSFLDVRYAAEGIYERESSRAEQTDASGRDREGEREFKPTFLRIKSTRAQREAGDQHGDDERPGSEANTHAGQQGQTSKEFSAGGKPGIRHGKWNTERAEVTGEAVQPGTAKEAEEFLRAMKGEDRARHGAQKEQCCVLRSVVSNC
jgi:hypothetical protein